MRRSTMNICTWLALLPRFLTTPPKTSIFAKGPHSPGNCLRASFPAESEPSSRRSHTKHHPHSAGPGREKRALQLGWKNKLVDLSNKPILIQRRSIAKAAKSRKREEEIEFWKVVKFCLCSRAEQIRVQRRRMAGGQCLWIWDRTNSHRKLRLKVTSASRLNVCPESEALDRTG
jgi:hypothetical protein